MGTQSNLGWFEWVMVAMPSSIPFVNIYLFNIAQSVIAIFLAGSFLKRDKKLDTAEVIYVRPMSNADYIIGKTWGIVKVFVSLNIIALLIAGFIHLFASESPFTLFPYFFYLLTLSIPSLIFVLGLSFVIMSFIRNQAVTFVIMLGFIGVTLSYLGDAEHGTFDFFALTVPNMFSDVLGHTNLFPYLVQRLTFLLLGMGLLTFTIAMVNRLPLHPKKNILLNALGCIILIAGIGCGFTYFSRFNHVDNQRKLYSERYKKYNNIDKVHLIDQEIIFSQTDKKITVNSHVKIQNRNHQEIDKIVFYLNPSLQVEKLTRQGEDIPYKRDAQVIITEYKLRPYESLELDITYNGSIDENICYLD
ncbi:MAG: ABC transporter permease, partial [Butyricimonas faecihominis]